jgi:hypothetical protein
VTGSRSIKDEKTFPDHDLHIAYGYPSSKLC